MHHYNFKGDLNRVSERQLAFIEEVLQKRNIKGPDVLMEPVGKAGDNFIADVKRITIHEKNGEIIKMIAKVAPEPDHIMRHVSNVAMLFRNEHVVYTEILPKFDQLQIEAGIPKEDMYRYPECYGSLSEEPNEIILLEDLKQSDLEMLSKFKPLSNECVNIAIRNLAKFHSFSYALKNWDPETYKTMKSKLRDLMTEHFVEVDLSLLFQSLDDMASDCMDNEIQKNIVQGTISDIVSLATECIKADQDSKFSVIRLGDLWTNNIMFRMNEIPEECVLIDYQNAFEASPAYDIFYLILNSTDHEQRLKQFHNFIDVYHTELDKSLNNFGLKADLIYPREQLNTDLKRYAKYAFANSILISSAVVRTPEEYEVLKEIDEARDMNNLANKELPEESYKLAPNSLVRYKKKVEDLVHTFLGFGLLTWYGKLDVDEEYMEIDYL